VPDNHDNQLLNEGREEGLFLNLDCMVKCDNGNPVPVQMHSTSRSYRACSSFTETLPAEAWPDNGRLRIGHYLGTLSCYAIHLVNTPLYARRPRPSAIAPAWRYLRPSMGSCGRRSRKLIPVNLRLCNYCQYNSAAWILKEL